MARILGFINEATEDEYIVITEEEEEETPAEDWAAAGFRLLCEVRLDEDVDSLPTERNLWKHQLGR